jgi:hypothetical protein
VATRRINDEEMGKGGGSKALMGTEWPDRGNLFPISSRVRSLVSPLNVFLSLLERTDVMGVRWPEEAPEQRPDAQW